MARFVTDKQRRAETSATQADIDAKAKAAYAAKVQEARPIFDRIAPIIEEILREFAQAREMHTVSIRISDKHLDVALNGNAPSNREHAIYVRIDVYHPHRLLFTTPVHWHFDYENEEDLKILAQMIADETGLRTDITGYDDGRGEYIRYSFGSLPPTTNTEINITSTEESTTA